MFLKSRILVRGRSDVKFGLLRKFKFLSREKRRFLNFKREKEERLFRDGGKLNFDKVWIE